MVRIDKSKLEEILNRCRSMKADQPKERKPKGHPEEDLQKKCVAWFREHYPDLAPLLFHPYNGAYFGSGRTKAQQERAGKRAKDFGVTPGVADLILLYPSDVEHALCIEMKTKTGRLEDVQREWAIRVFNHGYRYEIIRTFEDFQALIVKYTNIAPLDEEKAALTRIFGKDIRKKVER